MSTNKLSQSLFLLLLLLFLSSTSNAHLPLQIQSFIQCFTNQTQSPKALSLPNTPSYNSVLLSSAQNQRFIASPSYSKPSLIVSATSESHVQSAVLCARSAGLSLRVRSGGHDYEAMSYSAASAGSVFVAIDLSALRSVSVDRASQTAWVQSGATLGELYYAVAKNHPTSAFPAGLCPTVGVGGHIAGGGIGALTRKFGVSVDNVADARLVDARGRLLDRSSMGEDLFWAVRGAGSAGFGIVLAFKVELAAVPPLVTVFTVGRTLEENATALVVRWQDVAHRLDANLFIRMLAQAEGRTIRVTFNSLFLGRKEELLKLAQSSFPELRLRADDCREMSWLESTLYLYGQDGKPVEQLLDREPEFNSSFKGKSDFVEMAIPERGLEEIWGFMMEGSGEHPVVLILDPMGGRMDEIREDAVAFPHRKGNLYNVQYFMRWFERGEEEKRHLEWMRRLHALMAPYVSSRPRAAYYNYKDVDLGWNEEGKGTDYSAARLWGRKYFKGNFERLAKLKTAVDPTNFFWNELSLPLLKKKRKAKRTNHFSDLFY